MVNKIKNVKNRQGGFTIIEVLIVLAIAGLILLIVFLAVPALQRNARNTARKNDVAGILGALTEYTNNHNGTFPADCAAGACNAANTWLSNAKIGTIDVALVSFKADAGAAAPANPTVLDAVDVYGNVKCDTTPANIGKATKTNASKRSVVALYQVETGGAAGKIDACVESGS